MSRFGRGASKAWIGAAVPAALVIIKHIVATQAGTDAPTDAEIGGAFATLFETGLAAAAGFGLVYSIPNRPKEGAE